MVGYVLFVIGGEDVRIGYQGGQRLIALLDAALRRSGNTRRGIEEWQMRAESGQVLDPLMLAEEHKGRIFVSLPTGLGL